MSKVVFAPSRVAVLMATYNGVSDLQEQVDSILRQSQVDVTLFCSDDVSTDGTYDVLLALAGKYQAIQVLPKKAEQSGAGGNFYHLVCALDLTSFDYIAYSDQDDIWNVDKLSRHIELLQQHGADAVSSNALAFWPDGTKKLIVKSQPQCRWDYLFESAGPGCTFLMTPRLVARVKDVLRCVLSAKTVNLHDWLTYAVARASGFKWIIDAKPSILYRQHGRNVVGANTGLRAKWVRIKKMRECWYRQQVADVSKVVYTINHDHEVENLLSILPSKSWNNRLVLLRYAWHGRRSAFDRWGLILSILLGFF